MTSINGFLVSPSTAALGVRAFLVPGTSVKLTCRADIAPLLIGAAAQYHRRVQPLHPGWCWGYAYRLVRGGSTPSFHSAGIAVDLNAPAHPIGTSPSSNYSAGQIAQCRAIARAYGLRWGGDYSGRKDGMHFEVILPHAAAIALAHRVQHLPAPAPAAPQFRLLQPYPPSGPFHLGTSGHSVAGIQHRLREIGAVRTTENAKFDVATKADVSTFQSRHHLAIDGTVGPATWRVLFSYGARF
jgi:hypothetical protein